jgi:hypothetical protein
MGKTANNRNSGNSSQDPVMKNVLKMGFAILQAANSLPGPDSRVPLSRSNAILLR